MRTAPMGLWKRRGRMQAGQGNDKGGGRGGGGEMEWGNPG